MNPETLSSLVVILVAVTLSPLIADFVAPWMRLPAVVLELLAGVAIGPSALGWASFDETITFLAEIGLCMLFFLGGLEIDIPRIRGGPLKRSLSAWSISFVLAGCVGLIVALGDDSALSGLLVGLAMTTTAFGVLLPILRDSGELSTGFGTEILAGSMIGEVGPIVVLAALFGTDAPGRTVIVLMAFIAVVIGSALMARRQRSARVARVIETTLDTSGQFAVRLAVLFLTLMVLIAADLGLDVLLGAFAAGMVTRLFAGGSSHREAELIESKLNGIGFGFLIPLFFVVSGMKIDLESIVDDPLILVVGPAFLLCFLVVRGFPAWLMARSLPGPDRLALAFYLATQLPLVVVITTLGVETQRMSPSTAAALITAAIGSVLIYPLIGSRLRHSEPSAHMDMDTTSTSD